MLIRFSKVRDQQTDSVNKATDSPEAVRVFLRRELLLWMVMARFDNCAPIGIHGLVLFGRDDSAGEKIVTKTLRLVERSWELEVGVKALTAVRDLLVTWPLDAAATSELYVSSKLSFCTSSEVR